MTHPFLRLALRTPILYLVAGFLFVLLAGLVFGWIPKPFDQLALALLLAILLGLFAASRELQRILLDLGA